MTGKIPILVALCLLCLAASASADGLLYQLPADGTWVQYDMSVTLTVGDEPSTMAGSLRLSCVGAVTEKIDGKDIACRWLECVAKMKRGDVERVAVIKLLVPTVQLAAGKEIVAKRVRGWIREPGEDKEKNLEDKDLGPLPAWLAGPLKDPKKLEPIEVESKLGKLPCAGVSGSTTFKDGTRTNAAHIETRRHAKAPFGVVSSKIKITEQRESGDSTYDMHFVLKDLGTDAKSLLPDAK